MVRPSGEALLLFVAAEPRPLSQSPLIVTPASAEQL